MNVDVGQVRNDDNNKASGQRDDDFCLFPDIIQAYVYSAIS